MREILPHIYELEVPLKGSPLRAIHPYLITGGKRNLLIDTAFNTDECEAVLLAQMNELDITLDDTDIFLTHLHVDHCGLISRLKTEKNKIYASALDKAYIDNFQNPTNWPWIGENNLWAGVPDDDALTPEQHVAFLNRPSFIVPIEVVSFGDILTYGDYSLEVIDLAGHTRGQIGLWYKKSNCLFCGDHILGTISPNISAWDVDNDYVQMYLDHLQAVKQMNLNRLFAAHGTEISNPNERIDQLINHHKERLAFMENIVKTSARPVTAYYVATQTEWSKNKSFHSLPPQQKWFASSETLAHLISLAHAGRVHSALHGQDNCYYFSA